MKPFTLRWWMQMQKEEIVEAELAWAKYIQDRARTDKRGEFIDRWTTVHWMHDRIINKYGE